MAHLKIPANCDHGLRLPGRGVNPPLTVVRHSLRSGREAAEVLLHRLARRKQTGE